jgi:hypothetical protein
MLIIASSDMPLQARKRLAQEGNVLWLDTQPEVYDSIATHPDIFFCQLRETLVASPRIPRRWTELIESNEIRLVFGSKTPSGLYPSTACFNAVVTDTMLIHNTDTTDPLIITHTDGCLKVHVAQGYTRCNLLPLNNDHFISSDKGISNALTRFGASVLTVTPQGILLKGQKHGFFGGACGIRGNEVFVCGNLDRYADGGRVKDFVGACGYTITELFDGLLTDVGSIFFAGA